MQRTYAYAKCGHAVPIDYLNENEIPIAEKMIERYMCIPCTLVPAERGK